MPYHEVKDPFQTAQDVLFEQLRKAGAEKQRQLREQEHYQSMNDYLKEQVQNYNNGVDPADNEGGYGTEKTNREVQDSMNEKLADKGITVDNVDTKHVSDETQDMTLANRPTTDDKVKDSMNEKLADKGITVDNVNTKPVSNAEHVTMDRTQSKTDTVGTGTATTSGQPDKKLPTQPKTSDSPLGDMETMSKMKTSTTTSTGMGAPKPETSSTPKPETSSTPKPETSSTPKPETASTPKPETATTPKTEVNTPKTETSTPKTEISVPKNETSVPKTETTREKLADKDVNLVKNINPPKTEQKRFKDDSGYATRVVPNEPSARIAKGSENKTTPAKTTLPKGGVQADSAGLVGLKNAKSFKK